MSRDAHMQAVETARLYALDLRDVVEDLRERQLWLMESVKLAVGDHPTADPALQASEAAILVGVAMAEVAQSVRAVSDALGEYMRLI